jgi:hypothetical protein
MFTLGGCENATSSKGLDDFPDTYTHASQSPDPNAGSLTGGPGSGNKTVLTGAAFDNAIRFLEDSSHYLYVQKDLNYFPSKKYANGFDETWRSPVNDRVYRGPYWDVLSRSVDWLSINPNGAVSVSLGSYWGLVSPERASKLTAAGQINNVHGYIPSDKPQVFSYNSSGQMVNNWIERKRGTFAIDGSLAHYYGLTGAQHLFIEVKLNHYEKRSVTPEEFYDGLIPESWSMGVHGQWNGYATENGKPYYDFAGYWALTDAERATYCAQAENDPVVMDILTNTGGYFWFDIIQIVKLGDLIGFEYESSQGKINAIDQDHDGFLDKYEDYLAGGKQASRNITVQIPDGKTASDYIISYNSQNAEGPNENQLRMPTEAFAFNWREGWWWNWFNPGPLQPVQADGSPYTGQ